VFDGTDITALDEHARRPLRRRMQMIFQDPMSSLNPRHTIGRILIEPVLLHGLAPNRAAALELVHGVLDRVGLARATVERYSYELSGGQRQRVGIARAVVLRPDFVLADEIVSGLDVSTQAQVLRLLQELTREMHLALAFISHDLSVIRSICQRVVVMRDGRVVEEGPCERVFAKPAAEYTRMLIDAIPLPAIDPGWLMRDVAAEGASATKGKKSKRGKGSPKKTAAPKQAAPKQAAPKQAAPKKTSHRRKRAARRDGANRPDRS
jgi:ABC-type microcin C transport system duplicated ATPase subunit YejF